jgi:hypothetical protein
VARLFDRMKGDEAPPASASVAYRGPARRAPAQGAARSSGISVFVEIPQLIRCEISVIMGDPQLMSC